MFLNKIKMIIIDRMIEGLEIYLYTFSHYLTKKRATLAHVIYEYGKLKII